MDSAAEHLTPEDFFHFIEGDMDGGSEATGRAASPSLPGVPRSPGLDPARGSTGNT